MEKICFRELESQFLKKKIKKKSEFGFDPEQKKKKAAVIRS